MRLPVNGISLNVEIRGTGAPLVLLHGFTGSAATWRSRHFDNRYQLIAIDLLGHGESESPADPARYSIEHCAQDLLTLFDYLRLDQVNLLGYSMGGRVALYFALAYPDRVQTLILESASPGLADAAERRSRIASDEQLAASIERDGLASFVEYWSTIPLFSSQQRLPESQQTEIRVQRLLNNPQGLANSLRGLGTGVQPSLWDRLVELKMPALIMAGELDHKFAGIAQRMEIPNRKVVIVPDAGHAVHLEQPATFDRIVVGFLEK